jgi:hypothetical protein
MYTDYKCLIRDFLVNFIPIRLSAFVQLSGFRTCHKGFGG